MSAPTPRHTALRQIRTYLAVTYATVLTLALAFPSSGWLPVAMMFTPTLGVAVAIALTTPSGERRAAWAGVALREHRTHRPLRSRS